MIANTLIPSFTPMQREIVRAIQLHGGIVQTMAVKNGWVNAQGVPEPEMQQLIREYRVVAPRVLTSQPLRVVWQFRSEAMKKDTLAKIEREATRLNLKEYAPGGFMLNSREKDRELAMRRAAALVNPRAGRGRGF